MVPVKAINPLVEFKFKLKVNAAEEIGKGKAIPITTPIKGEKITDQKYFSLTEIAIKYFKQEKNKLVINDKEIVLKNPNKTPNKG